MNCEKAKRLLVDYSEGLLGEGKRRAVEEHLSTCEVCRRELEQIERLKEGVLSLETPERDAEFWRRFHNKLSRRLDEEAETMTTTLGFRRRMTLRFAAVAAVAALLAIGSFLIFGVRNFRPAPVPRVAEETTSELGVDVTMSEMDAFTDDVLSGTLLAQVDSSNADIEPDTEDMYLLIEEDLQAVPDDPAEMVPYDIYEPTINDLLDDLSDEDFEEIYNGLASI